MKTIVLAVFVLALCSLSSAEPRNGASPNNQPAAGALAPDNSQRPPSAATCAFTFTSGAGDTFLKYCVTANGNMTEFQTPEGHEHIAVAQIGEGYGIFEHKAPNSFANYNDYAEYGDSGNWAPATVVSQTAKSVKITRTTSDGIWTLTQTFTQFAGTAPSVRIDMTLKNNSNTPREVDLVRYANVDADGIALNQLSATANSSFAWNFAGDGNPRSGFGVQLQGAPFKADPRSDPLGVVQFGPFPPPDADPLGESEGASLKNTDGSLLVRYNLVVPGGRSKTVTVSYKGL